MAKDVEPNRGCKTQGDVCYGVSEYPGRVIDIHDSVYCCGGRVPADDPIGGPVDPGTGESINKKLCLTDEGLVYWKEVLGSSTYQTWFNAHGSNTTLYGCSEITELEGIQATINEELYTTDCEYTIYSRSEAEEQITNYKNLIRELEKENEKLTEEIVFIESQTTTVTNEASCTSYVDLFENFSISFAIEVDNEPVYQENIFNIGQGNLWEYIKSSSGATGIIIGDQNTTLNNLCEEQTQSETSCNNLLLKSLLSEIYDIVPEEDRDTPNLESLISGWWDSCWLKFEKTICDQETINQMMNQDINMAFYVNNTCTDFQILLDRVKLNKRCETVNNVETFISEPPKFEVTKIIDNKKSWIALDTKDERFYDLKYRPAEYDVNHHKLVINTKEVDLNLSPARAVEQDIWCYMQDNNILTCSGTTGTTTGITSDEYYSHPVECSYSATCDVSKLVLNYPLPHDTMTDYSGIWTKDIFETFGACDTTYGCDEDEHMLYRSNRDTYFKDLNEYTINKSLGWNDTQNPDYPVTSISGLQQDTSVLGGYSINDIKNIPMVGWYHASAYTEYYVVSPSGNSLNVVFSGSDVTYQPAVDSLTTLTGITGNPGDIRGVEPYSAATYYFWNPLTNDWEDTNDGTNDIANLIEGLQINRRGNRDARLKAYNEAILATRPFLFANKYIPDFQVKKYIIGDGE
jgi:hypothetical protein